MKGGGSAAFRARPGMCLLLTLVALGAGAPGGLRGQEQDYLTPGEMAGVGGASLGLMVVGGRVADFDPAKPSLWPNPPSWEVAVARWLGGEPRAGKRNFLDDFAGAAATPAVAGALVLGLDLAYPADRRGRDVLQDALLLTSGLAATKGITDLVKGIVARPRPLTHMAPEIAEADEDHGPAGDRRSFFSGHTSVAFFAAAYLNRHARATMRRELSPTDYRDWRWVPPLASYGWAAFVGISRIQAHRHYPTDVAAGALTGAALGALFYSLGRDETDTTGAETPDGPPLVLAFTFSF